MAAAIKLLSPVPRPLIVVATTGGTRRDILFGMFFSNVINTLGINVLGWVTVAAIFAATVGLVITWFV